MEKHSSQERQSKIGVDIGGTFTDFVLYHPSRGELKTYKCLSTPNNPAQAVLRGLEQLGVRPPAWLLHGTTVATNALLEGKGARTALITTQGFRDVLQIGRQNRPALYDFSAEPPRPLVPQELRFEVAERISAQGEVLMPLNLQEVEALLPRLKAEGVEAVAVCLLFSFLYPEHEERIGQILAQAGYPVSLSSQVLPEYREYERMSTTVVNAYVSPVLSHYLHTLEHSLPVGLRLQVMQSNGGIISAGEAMHNGVRCILSGPAGGVVGAEYIASLAARAKGESDRSSSSIKVITFDMGGTSTDVSLIDGAPQITTEASIGGYPIRIPILDIHTIGAGGGSIAYHDVGGALRVGPQSAGSEPGPACYGKGELPTVTDANLVLGRLPADHFLGGEMPLDRQRAERALEQLGRPLGLSSTQVALGIVAVVNAHMERALRVISVERGYDPREFTLLSFGGAGGLHAADLARGLGIPRVLVPPMASTFSAFGMLAAEVVKDYTQTVMLPAATPIEEIKRRLERLIARGLKEMQEEGLPGERIRLETALDMRYIGQSYELTLPFSPAFIEEFHRKHEHSYGYARQDAPVEIVNLRVWAIGEVQPPSLERQQNHNSDSREAFLEHRLMIFPEGKRRVPCYAGEKLRCGHELTGPALVVRPDTTILLAEGDTAYVDAYLNLIIEVAAQW